MSAPADAAGMADLIARIGLMAEHEVKDFLFEVDDKRGPAEPFVRLLERKGKLTPFQGGKLLKGDGDGYFMGGYRILYKIASGSFGRVYRGDDPRTGQVVAVKVLRRKWSDDPKRIKQFEQEGRIGLTLQHPNIVQILAVSRDASTSSHFIVMEFVEGGNLRDILNIRKKLELGDALRVMAECADGLAHAYERGLMHRDIKPSNILLGTDGVAKLVDFGLAEMNQPAPDPLAKKKKGEEVKEEQADRTLDYAGLERATGVKSGDIRSDIYFLGQVLFEMIAGEPLVERSRERRIATDRRRFEMIEETLAQKAKQFELPPMVRGVISKALAFNPLSRFQRPENFHEALQNCRRELGLMAEADARDDADFPAADETAADAGPTYPPAPTTVVVVERNAKLQEAFRERFTKMGLRVLMTSEAGQAAERYPKKPFHAVVIDAGTVGAEGATALAKILASASAANNSVAAILLLNADDAALAVDFLDDPRAGVLIRPVTMKQLSEKLAELMPGVVESGE